MIKNDFISKSVEEAKELIKTTIVPLAVELDGREHLFEVGHVFRDKGEIVIDYRVATEELNDYLNAVEACNNDDIETLRALTKSTTSGELLTNIVAYLKE